jgi:hypothetical protein
MRVERALGRRMRRVLAVVVVRERGRPQMTSGVVERALLHADPALAVAGGAKIVGHGRDRAIAARALVDEVLLCGSGVDVITDVDVWRRGPGRTLNQHTASEAAEVEEWQRCRCKAGG